MQICILEHNRTTHDDMHKLDEDFYLIVSLTILMNFIALKYESKNIIMKFLNGVEISIPHQKPGG